jgi:4'-phosphopantetheinyl transferase
MTIRVHETGIGPGEVHLWRSSLRSSDAQVSYLSDDELARADAYYFEKDRVRFVAARRILREILGRYLNVPPNKVEFSYGAHGKPALANNRHLKFNLSHSTDVALIAVARGVEIGVDVESSTMLAEQGSIAERFMSENEYRLLGSMPREQRSAAILTTWVRKEAVAKGRGDGLGAHLATIETRPGEPATATPVVTGTASQGRWFVSDVPMGADMAGAMAASRSDLVVQVADYTDSVFQRATASPSIDVSASPHA